MIDDGRVADPGIGREGLFLGFLRLLGGFGLCFGSFRFSRRFLGVAADRQGVAAVFLRPVLVLRFDDIVHLERQVRVVQAVGGQIRLGGLVGHVVCEVQIGHGGEIVLHQGRIEDGVVGVVPVVLGVGPVAVLLIGDFVVRRTGDGDRRGVVKDRDLILVDEVAELHVVAVHGVRGHQIDLAVADGDVALLI